MVIIFINLGYSIDIYPKNSISYVIEQNYIRLNGNKNTVDGQRILVVIMPL